MVIHGAGATPIHSSSSLHRGLHNELMELLELSRWLCESESVLRPELEQGMLELEREFNLIPSTDVFEHEKLLSNYSRYLRRTWLRFAADQSSRVLRTPTVHQSQRLSRFHDSYGYERDYQPVSLEKRCKHFFPKPPAPWSAKAILFSSGQAALTCALLAANALAARQGGTTFVRHNGAYFETGKLVRNYLNKGTERLDDASAVVSEPVFYEEGFRRPEDTDPGPHHTQDTEVHIIDTTLQPHDMDIGDHMHATNAQYVVRLTSGLKLLQAGLELSNMGILLVHARDQSRLESFCSELRELRTLTGTGLSFFAALTLEAPFVFDNAYTRTYESAVFENNAKLARAVAGSDTPPKLCPHPSLFAPDAKSPFCAFQISRCDGSLDAIADTIEAEAKRRNLYFERGGSFGFRNHRFEVVNRRTGGPSRLAERRAIHPTESSNS